MNMQIQIVAKTLVTNADGMILVLRRHDDDDYRPGEWDLPGGQAEPGEDPQAAAMREAYEEVGLVLDNLRPIHVTSRIYGTRQVIKTIFQTTTYAGTPKLSHEHSELEWIEPDELVARAISQDYIAAAQMLAATRVPAAQ